MKIKALSGATLVILSSFFYASYGIWTKLMGNFFGGYTASALRSVLVIALLLPIAGVHRKLEPVHFKRNWHYLMGMFVASLFTWGPLYYAILHAGVGVSLTINYATSVLGTFFFGWLLASERFTRLKALSTVLGIVGLTLIYSPGRHELPPLALIAATVSGLSVGANTVFVKKVHYGPTQSAIVLWVASILANFLMALILHESVPKFDWHMQWLYLVLFAIASTVASWTFARGLKLIEAGIASLLGLLEVVFAVFFGVLFFHERPSALVLLGVVTIIIAITVPYSESLAATRALQPERHG